MPVQICSAGPTRDACRPSMETTSDPPGITMRTGLSLQPRATAAAATAAADEPDAAVSPAPRSHTSTDTTSRGSGRASWTFVRAGKARMRLDRRAEAEQVFS